MSDPYNPQPPVECPDAEALRLEAVITCIGFDDILDETIPINHPQFDTLVVVTEHTDHKTQAVCKKHGVTCVQSDLFKKDLRHFNKGAAINAGMDYYRFRGWRMVMDADIFMPFNFRRELFNHTHLDDQAIYGADRIDVIGKRELDRLLHSQLGLPQHQHGCFVHPISHRPLSPRYVDNLRGYCPLGFFQLWNYKTQKPYPHSLGTASHDDVMFSALWPRSYRHVLPSSVVYHLCPSPPYLGENWDGFRKSHRLK
jgi:hypothetical protein